MTREQLVENIKKKRSFLCVGLDTDVRKLPASLMDEENPMLQFNKAIIDATASFCVAYKPNLAFYEAMGSYGLQVFEDTIRYINEYYPDQFIIADGKRGDIGNTGSLYARAYAEHFKVDAITVAPYMGEDSVKPFFEGGDMWVVLLALTSNDGARDFQLQKLENGHYLFEEVLAQATKWSSHDHLMFVVGATQAEYLRRVRQLVPEHFLLIPGIGAQGGDLEMVVNEGITPDCGLLVNSSRGIIYADSGEHFATSAAHTARAIQQQMEHLLIEHKVL